MHAPETAPHRRTAIVAILGGVVAAALLAAPLVHVAQSAPVPASSQDDYPVLPAPALAMTIPTSLTDQIATATLVVDATVKQVLPDVTKTVDVKPGSAEDMANQKAGHTGSDTVTFGAVAFTVNDVLLGSIGSSLVMEISPYAMGCVPDFRPGDRMVLFLYQPSDGSYRSVSMQDSYWYVAKDQKVYPAVVTDKLKEYSGKGLGPFKSQINQIKDALKKK